MPITVFSVGVMMGTEKFSMPYAANMMLVGVGVATASYGEHQAGWSSTMMQIKRCTCFLCTLQLPGTSSPSMPL